MITSEKLLKTIKESEGISTDSRYIKPGQIFFALKGPNFDGNEYVEAAFKKGAKYAVCQNAVTEYEDKCLIVPDSLSALQDAAKAYRSQLHIPFIGLTGSNGKTTTKELLAAILSKKYKVHATKGNFNNHIGVPLTILAIPEDSEVAILEMGANHRHEIEGLCAIASPDIGVITSIGKAHLEGFLSLEGVAYGKTELFNSVRRINGPIFFHSGEFMLDDLTAGYHNRTVLTDKVVIHNITYQVDSPVFAPRIRFSIRTSNDQLQFFDSCLFGSYNFKNIWLATALGLYFEVSLPDISDAISSYMPENNRSQIVSWRGATVMLDAYNANPTSMKLAIEQFLLQPYQRKILVLGSMKEVGEFEKEEHSGLLESITDCGFEQVFLVGEEWQHINTLDYPVFNDVKELIAEWANKYFSSDTGILLKGSRSNTLEKLLDL